MSKLIPINGLFVQVDSWIIILLNITVQRGAVTLDVDAFEYLVTFHQPLLLQFWYYLYLVQGLYLVLRNSYLYSLML